MSEVCDICFLQTQSTVTSLVHQNSAFHSRELTTKMRNNEICTLKPTKIQSSISSMHRFHRISTCYFSAAVWWEHRRTAVAGVLGWVPGKAGTRKWLKEMNSQHLCNMLRRGFRQPSFPRITAEGKAASCYATRLKTGSYTLVCLPSMLSCQLKVLPNIHIVPKLWWGLEGCQGSATLKLSWIPLSFQIC